MMKNKSSRCALLLAAVLAATHGPAPAQWFGGRNRDTGTEQDRGTITQAAAAFAGSHEAWAQPYLSQLFADGEWGAVLNFMRLGLAAMEKQKFTLAQRALDQAIARVEQIYAGDANAEKAKSTFNAEAVKDFKGEPYERAMLYYYRGLLYAQEGDYQNARASFLAADRHITLSSAEAATYTSDFGLLKYLAGWASYCDGDPTRGEQLVGEARNVDSKIQSLPQVPGSSLVLVDSGPAPVKWGDGEYKQILKFKAGDGIEPAAQVKTASGKTIDSLSLAGDLVHQATTRGGREVDGILQGKAQFKETAGQVGAVAMNVGATAAMMGSISGNRDMAGAGLLGMFIGMAAKSAEAAANPAADIRSWDTLPARIHAYLDADAAQLPPKLVVNGAEQVMPLAATHGRCSLAWGRTTASSFNVTPPAGNFNPEINRGDRNKALREALERDFLASR